MPPPVAIIALFENEPLLRLLAVPFWNVIISFETNTKWF